MVFETVKDIIVEQLGIDESEVTKETDLENGLDADSLDIFQIISDIEDEYDITIDTDLNLQTVGELVDYVEQLIG
ncbi:acyl carrier protein [Dolosigranulum pigrum]|uniref:Acyl carrier protein n=3 Tax=Dolosigranulum TaxID=29393 RepID=H3NCQ7_9LACT|nr:acyl carrier protein [Dolosigranulum pigrum]EHR34933.1 acyl carrier protein [Dolosigranulum pigrum ATCC 51524]OOL81755.1 acyl carrier protein [Dolosigranulum pigrum]QDO90723.1 acyl carrier protein [Dolosigranulum pigrum]QJS95550.1 acyl carrier protein [Dolosigranulum pigrum]QJS97598.1 acyl carrier protein [Dolosigranulum pigrum]